MGPGACKPEMPTENAAAMVESFLEQAGVPFPFNRRSFGFWGAGPHDRSRSFHTASYCYLKR